MLLIVVVLDVEFFLDDRRDLVDEGVCLGLPVGLVRRAWPVQALLELLVLVLHLLLVPADGLEGHLSNGKEGLGHGLFFLPEISI